MTVGISGASSQIAVAFTKMLPVAEPVRRSDFDEMPLDLDRYLICNGVLYGRPAAYMALEDAAETYLANCFLIARLCDRILSANNQARICIIGSESAFAGSYDTAYATAKAGLHHYVRRKKLHDEQQLVALAPHIIGDAGMTLRRKDLDETLERGTETRLGRWITAEEVAGVAYYALYAAPLFLSNTIIRLSGAQT